MKKIAVLRADDDNLSFELDELSKVCKQRGIECQSFYVSEPILNYHPDCVIVTSPQHAKLTPFPTYGLINRPRDEYLSIPRFLRNILTYDGHLTFSPRLETMLKDLMFGARKLDASVLKFDLFASQRDASLPAVEADYQKITIFEPDFSSSRFKTAINTILDKIPSAQVLTFSVDGVERNNHRFQVISELSELDTLIQQSPIAVTLSGGDEQEHLINAATIKLVMAGAITITHETTLLKNMFNDTLNYLSPDLSVKELSQALIETLHLISAKQAVYLAKAKAARDIAEKTVSLDVLMNDFIAYHERVLIKKGYVPNPDKAVEAKLPSVTYIMRTGGKHRPFLERALDCLVAQQYPDMRVIFVTHVKVPFIHEIIAAYPSIQFKVLESIKSKRSEAIRDGMAAVETDLFGLFDDDDELFPNHVRSLVKTMQYHSNRDWRGEIGMVYSGSIHADDTYSVYERVEFHDDLLVDRKEKRAIEHFRYYSSALMSQHAWFMPNGWLARASLIDNEILEDPGLDTCEDLYFELQIAQRRQMAFSVEVTAIHHFHHLGNSTNDDSHKHLPDTQRIALRNFSRTFPMDAQYDTGYNIVGRPSMHDANQIAYQDFKQAVQAKSNANQFFPFRQQALPGVAAMYSGEASRGKLHLIIGLPAKVVRMSCKFITMDPYRRRYYLEKLNKSITQYGVMVTLTRAINFLSNRASPGLFIIKKTAKRKNTGFIQQIKSRVMRAANIVMTKFGGAKWQENKH
jgi:hypothetical protein